MEVSQREMQKKAASQGLLLGLILLCIGIAALYIIARTESIALVIGSPILLSFIFPILFAILFCIRLRKQIGGFWTFREATSGIFVLFITAYLFYTGGNYIHSKFIDPAVTKAVKENIVKVTEKFASKQDIPAEEIDEKMDEMRTQLETETAQSPGQIIQSIVFAIIIIFVGSLLFATVFKKEPPVFLNTIEE